VSIHDLGQFATLNTVTRVDNFDSYIYNTDMTLYTPVNTISDLMSTPVLSDFGSFVEYYTDKNLMFYEAYNIPTNNGIAIQTYRTTNGYNNGLFAEPRLSYGVYSFLGEIPEIPETYPTSGVIGSFYFGGDYTNVDISGNTLSVTFEPVSTAISIDMNNLLKDISTITLNVINRSDYVTAQDTLFVDFVAKRRNSDTYPKFCKCDDSICTIDDKAIYDKAIIGGDPIIVDFSACTNAVGTHTDYKPIEYHWYFDYGTYPNDYEITTEPYATHTYCGGYLEAFDVKLCVQFA
jgi:hypothetical protein